MQQSTTKQAEYLSIEECAALLGVHHSTVRRQINSGRLPAYKVGRIIRIPRAALAELEPAAPWAHGHVA